VRGKRRSACQTEAGPSAFVSRNLTGAKTRDRPVAKSSSAILEKFVVANYRRETIGFEFTAFAQSIRKSLSSTDTDFPTRKEGCNQNILCLLFDRKNPRPLLFLHVNPVASEEQTILPFLIDLP